MKTVKLEVERTYNDDQLVCEAFWLDGKLHNPNGPAAREWNENGQLIHESYWLNGILHNPDGSAYRVWDDDDQLIDEQYWLDGKYLTKEQWQSGTQTCVGKIIEVEGKQYKLVEVSG